ncbi:replication-associated protein [robinz virus RP_99]|nr:replication-associated protein [robinz virus RP_99]
MLFVNSKYVLLTYAQSGDLDGWAVNDHMSSLGAECIVAREIHPTTGGVHLHVFVDFGRKFRSRSVRVFDVDGRHPNVNPSRGTPEKGFDYAIKDGEIVAGGLGRPEPRGGLASGAGKVSNVAHLCENQDEFLELHDEMDRDNLIKGFTNIRAYAKWRYGNNLPEYESPRGITSFRGGCDGRDLWVAQSGIRTGDAIGPKSLVLYGPSRTGKTTWARSLGKHVFFGGAFSGSAALSVDDDVKYAVFDDMRGGISFFHGWKDWLGAQQEFMVKQMYADPVLFKWGRPTIWCANKDPREEMELHMFKGIFTREDIDWMNANCIFVEVPNPIFHANTQ